MLFHFSDAPGIKRFVPRPVRSPSRRPKGQDWLNDPLVWAISAEYAFLYLFPRDCPRIVTWAKPDSHPSDQAKWLGQNTRVAYVEEAWMPQIARADIYRYALPARGFMSLDDVGMHVSRSETVPTGMTHLIDLPAPFGRSGRVPAPGAIAGPAHTPLGHDIACQWHSSASCQRLTLFVSRSTA